MEYKNKYIKYKNKYLNVKKDIILDNEDEDICIMNKILGELKLNKNLFLNLEINNLTDYMNNLFLKYKVNNNDTLQYSHWLYNNQLLMSAMPSNCEDIEHIVDVNKIDMIISLRENDELYQKCTELENKPIFWRFRIPDFGYQNASDFKALIDNIINYIYKTQKKIMIHCLGGHGRTGSVMCSIIGILVILQQDIFQTILTELYKLNNSIDKDCSKLKSDNILYKLIKENNISNIEMFTEVISNKVFLLSQIYVIFSLRKYRITDSINYRENIHAIVVPETSAQNEMVIDVIKLFLREYLINGKFNFDIVSTKKCNDSKIKNTNFKNAWLCAKNIDIKTNFENKKECD